MKVNLLVYFCCCNVILEAEFFTKEKVNLAHSSGDSDLTSASLNSGKGIRGDFITMAAPIKGKITLEDRESK